jgi:hypothetical protein
MSARLTLRQSMAHRPKCFVLQFESVHKGVRQAEVVVKPLTWQQVTTDNRKQFFFI